MKHFFSIIGGGFVIIAISIGIAWGAGTMWRISREFEPSRVGMSWISSRAQAIFAQPLEGTSVLGMVRRIRYTALQEEDPFDHIRESISQPLDGPITASAYIMKNVTQGRIEKDHNGDQLMPVASLTKLVTAVVARRVIAPHVHVHITDEVITTYGNTAGFRAGEVFRAEDLYYPLLMVSSNDAAEALAREYGRERFVQAMNDFAQSIGAYHTYFADSSGLSPHNRSTAFDMTIIMEWIRENDPEILDMTRHVSKTVRGHSWINPTHFLSWSNYEGGKNGYIPESNRTTASFFTAGPRKDLYVIVLLGSSSRDGDVAKLLAHAGK